MGYDLCRDGTEDEDLRYFRYNIWGWPAVMQLAVRYGWEPMGTTIPELSADIIRENDIPESEVQRHNTFVIDWCGDYSSNDGQIVNAKDAAAFAEALEKSLDDIPDHKIRAPGEGEDGTTSIADPLWQKHRDAIRAGSIPALVVTFSGKDSKRRLIKFIKFLRGGEFSIY